MVLEASKSTLTNDGITSNHSYNRDIPYLNYVENSGSSKVYHDNITNLDIPSSIDKPIVTNIGAITSNFNKYVENRDNDIMFADPERLDSGLSQLLESNNELLKYHLDGKNKLMNNITNRSRNLLNNYHYNNILKDTIENDSGNGEIDIVTKQLNTIDETIDQNRKELDVNIYYEKKFKHQIEIIKNVSIIMLFLLCITYLYKINLIQESVMVTLIGAGIFIIIMYTIYSIIDIILRDNMKYDEYKTIFLSDIYLNKGTQANRDKLKEMNLPLHAKKDNPPTHCNN